MRSNDRYDTYAFVNSLSAVNDCLSVLYRFFVCEFYVFVLFGFVFVLFGECMFGKADINNLSIS